LSVERDVARAGEPAVTVTESGANHVFRVVSENLSLAEYGWNLLFWPE